MSKTKNAMKKVMILMVLFFILLSGLIFYLAMLRIGKENPLLITILSMAGALAGFGIMHYLSLKKKLG